jgi:hypothetical protein
MGPHRGPAVAFMFQRPGFALHPPAPPPTAPWFGGRMLTWPGKTPR